MKMLKNIIVCISVLLVGSLGVIGQTLAADLDKIKSSFNSSQPFMANVETRYFIKESDTRPSLIKKGLVKKMGDNYFSSFDGKEYLINKKYTVMLDRGNKLIIVTGVDPQKAKKEASLSMPEFSKKMEEKMTIKRTASDNMVTYHVSDKQTGHLSFSVTIDSKTNRLTKMVHYGAPTYQRTEIIYKYPTESVSFTKEEFSESKYIKKENNTFKPTPAFNGFQISDQTR